MFKSKSLMLFFLVLVSNQPMAQLDKFKAGTTIPDFGMYADVPGRLPIDSGSTFRISFDVAKAANAGDINRSIESAARFINMHTAAGVPVENIELAVVIHGGAVKDVSQSSHDSTQSIDKKSHATLIKALQEKGVQFYVCGQSAAYYGVKTEDLLPGIKMSLSAMTAHAQLQQQGFTLNPF